MIFMNIHPSKYEVRGEINGQINENTCLQRIIKDVLFLHRCDTGEGNVGN